MNVSGERGEGGGTHTHAHAHKHTYTCTHAHTYTRTLARTHTHTHTRTYTHTLAQTPHTIHSIMHTAAESVTHRNTHLSHIPLQSEHRAQSAECVTHHHTKIHTTEERELRRVLAEAASCGFF